MRLVSIYKKVTKSSSIPNFAGMYANDAAIGGTLFRYLRGHVEQSCQIREWLPEAALAILLVTD
jgi:hypothetical protein